MKKRLLLLCILLLGIGTTFAQKSKAPKDFAKAIAMMQQDCPDTLKKIILMAKTESLGDFYYAKKDEWHDLADWTDSDNEGSGIRKYLTERGVLMEWHQQTILLIAFKKTLLGEGYDEEAIIRPYRLLEIQWAKEDSMRFTTDTLRGNYIPKDLEDCFKQLDEIWSDSTKQIVKQWTEQEFASRGHFSTGMWMRNNWRLWAGSRLSKYFNDIGIFHPDDMSSIILKSYHRYLLDKDLMLEEQVKMYQEYWKKMERNLPKE